MDYKEERRRTNQMELELYKGIVHTDKEGWQIEENQTELTYEQRMLYLYTEKLLFKRMGNDLETSNRKPSEILGEKYKDAVDAYIPKEKQSYALALLDSYYLFPYTRHFVIARSNSFSEAYSLSSFFMDFKKLQPNDKNNDIAETLFNNTLGEEKEKYLEEFITNKLLGKVADRDSDLNVYSLIRGKVSTRNEWLLNVLIELVKNNKLKEEIREDICWSLAYGTVEAFLLFFKTLVDNKMAKYRSVRKCVAAWTGLYEKKTYEQITDDTLADILKALTDESYRKQLLQSNNPSEFYLSIWAEGCFSVERAMELCLDCMKDGILENRLAVAYYATFIEKRHFSTKLAEIVLENFNDSEEDRQLLAAILPSYMRIPEKDYGTGHEIEEIMCEDIRCRVKEEVKPPKVILTYAKYFDSKEQARKHFSLLKRLYDILPKKKLHFNLCQLPIGKAIISRGEMAERMLLIAHCIQDETLKDVVCPMIPDINSDFRTFCFDMCCESPKTDIQRKTLIQALYDKKFEGVRNSANVILMEDFDMDIKKFRTLEFTAEELAQIGEVIAPYMRELFCL